MFLYFIFLNFFKFLVIVVPLLIAVAYLTLVERKIMAAVQRRKGPDVVGVWGVLQPIADGLKLFSKETILPSSANLVIFIIAPILTFLLALLGWVVIPIGENFVFSDLNIGVLYLLAISSLGVNNIYVKKFIC